MRKVRRRPGGGGGWTNIEGLRRGLKGGLRKGGFSRGLEGRLEKRLEGGLEKELQGGLEKGDLEFSKGVEGGRSPLRGLPAGSFSSPS